MATVKKESGKTVAKKNVAKKPVKSVKNVAAKKKPVVKKTAKKVILTKKKSVLTKKQQKEVKKIAESCQTKNAVKKKVTSGKFAKTEPKTNNVINDEMIGKKFNGITVLESAGSTLEGRSIYRCGCDCGTVFLASGTDIRTGRMKSCGCQGGHVRRKHYLGKSAIVGALEVLNQICMDYNCSQFCPLWETCHSKIKGSVKQFSNNALKEMEKRR